MTEPLHPNIVVYEAFMAGTETLGSLIKYWEGKREQARLLLVNHPKAKNRDELFRFYGRTIGAQVTFEAIKGFLASRATPTEGRINEMVETIFTEIGSTYEICLPGKTTTGEPLGYIEAEAYKIMRPAMAWAIRIFSDLDLIDLLNKSIESEDKILSPISITEGLLFRSMLRTPLFEPSQMIDTDGWDFTDPTAES